MTRTRSIPVSRHWRRRRHAAPLHLAIVDHDNGRFTIEGPIDSEGPWVIEVARAQKAGRRIDFYLMNGNSEADALGHCARLSEYERWPERSIVLPRRELK